MQVLRQAATRCSRLYVAVHPELPLQVRGRKGYGRIDWEAKCIEIVRGRDRRSDDMVGLIEKMIWTLTAFTG